MTVVAGAVVLVEEVDELDEEVEVDDTVVSVVLVGSLVEVDEPSGSVVVVVEMGTEVGGGSSVVTVVVGLVSSESCDADEVGSVLSADSDFEVWACALAGSREAIPPLESAPSGTSERLSDESSSGVRALGEPSSTGAPTTRGSSTLTALMARGAATPIAVTVDSVRASRKRVLPDVSLCWYRAIICESEYYRIISVGTFYRIRSPLSLPAGEIT